MTGTLYIVATPIGNLEDLTMRAVRVLKTVDWIAAEDTRHTGKLLQHVQSNVPQISYHEHNRTQRSPELLAKLQAGQAIALVSDAGMPGISDPGYELVRACAEANIPVVPIPGACAVVTALSASGLPSDRFVFEGFLPAKGQARRDRLQALVPETRTLVLYESPHRLQQTLVDLATTLGGDRPLTLARELTKLHEEFWRGTLQTAQAEFQGRSPQGEFTLVIAGASPAHRVFTDEALLSELSALIKQGLSRSMASRQLAQQTELSRRHIYQLALTLPDTDNTRE
jgi:16S rRNA (cytidine1402-2'-O)-methyltransferase